MDTVCLHQQSKYVAREVCTRNLYLLRGTGERPVCKGYLRGTGIRAWKPKCPGDSEIFQKQSG